MFTTLGVWRHHRRMERAFDAWRATPVEASDPQALVPSPEVLTVDQFARLARVSADVAERFLEQKAKELGIESRWEYFQGGPFWIEYPFPKDDP